MLGELFGIASDFFVLGLIPSIIAFIVVLVISLKKLKEKRYYVIKAIAIAFGAAIAIFLAICIIIYIIMFWLFMLCVIILGTFLIAVILCYVIGEILG